jgi:hypothetical protein
LFKSQYLPAPDKNSKEFEAVKRMVWNFSLIFEWISKILNFSGRCFRVFRGKWKTCWFWSRGDKTGRSDRLRIFVLQYFWEIGKYSIPPIREIQIVEFIVWKGKYTRLLISPEFILGICEIIKINKNIEVCVNFTKLYKEFFFTPPRYNN